MQVNVSVPVRRSGGCSQGIVTAAVGQVYHAAAQVASQHRPMSWSQLGHIVADGFIDLAKRVDDRDQHYRRWWADKVMTQARIALLTPFSPIGWTSQVSLEQSYRQIPADVLLRWDNEIQRKAQEAYNLQRRQEKEAEVAQQAAEEAERNNHSTAWIIWDEVGVFAEGGVSLFVNLVEGKPEVLKERANEVADVMARLIGMAVHPVETYHQISEASSGQKTRMMTELALGFLPLKTKLPKLPFDMSRPNLGMEAVGADGMVYPIAEKDVPSPEKNGHMRSEGTGDGRDWFPTRQIDPDAEGHSIQRVSELKSRLSNGALNKSGSNFAYAEVDISEIKKEFYAHSQVDGPPPPHQTKMNYDGFSFKPQGEIRYPAEDAPNSIGKLIPRNGDTEHKIINDLANQLGEPNPNITGKIKLFT